jgi:hypothetical protein
MLILIFLSYSFSSLADDISDFWDGLNRVGGPTGFEILQYDMHAKTNAAAGNLWEGGVHSLLTNPSEIMCLPEDLDNRCNFSFTYRKIFLDMNANFLGFTRKIGNNAFGISFIGFYPGDMELRRIPGDPIGTYDGENTVFGITYARSFKILNVGATIKSLNERIFEVSYSTYSFDLGMSRSFKAFHDKSFRLDFSFLHLGPKYGPEASEEKFRLPLTWHFGLKGNFEPLFLGFSLNKPLNTKLQYSIGGEYLINEFFSVRVGKRKDNLLEEFSFGFGLRNKNMNINYSYSPTIINSLDASHLFTISIGI